MAIWSHAITAIMAILSTLANMAQRIMVLNMADIGLYAKNRKNAELKNLQLLKSYGQNKIKSKIGAISFVFLTQKWPL